MRKLRVFVCDIYLCFQVNKLTANRLKVEYCINVNKGRFALMVNKIEILRQLKSIGVSFPFIGKPEINELPKILCEGETIKHIMNGRYEAGFAVLCATDHRLLLIDKRLMFLTIEDIRYDMISDVEFDHRLIDSSIHVGTVHKTINFNSLDQSRLRELTKYVQEEVMSYRQHLQRAIEQERQYEAERWETSNQAQASNIQNTVEQGVSPITQLNPYRSPIVISHKLPKLY